MPGMNLTLFTHKHTLMCKIIGGSLNKWGRTWMKLFPTSNKSKNLLIITSFIIVFAQLHQNSNNTTLTPAYGKVHCRDKLLEVHSTTEKGFKKI